jgi:hypothetical protein
MNEELSQSGATAESAVYDFGNVLAFELGPTKPLCRSYLLKAGQKNRAQLNVAQIRIRCAQTGKQVPIRIAVPRLPIQRLLRMFDLDIELIRRRPFIDFNMTDNDRWLDDLKNQWALLVRSSRASRSRSPKEGA